ncbi:succinylglutamate desuccinylase/aspartoacylase family protein [Portibacter lacus]|uniref:Succinylglutamate desuccinylase n=1 Tax=Portibacter lacus TaxID=1099794 RepID=A0AA37SN12_9BACT|nr:succinylglutamate desuccinylase/aspartoacylase family protein [Portibacter lacus]GLR17476.1 succinylglutamate desuccinylase [Portibacter lacus]
MLDRKGKGIFKKFRKEAELDEFIISNSTVLPGESTLIKLNVGRLPSGTRISIDAHVFRGKEDGPTALILGGVHGDEINGIEIVRRCLEEEVFDGITKGTIIAIPIVNIYGFINFSRSVPDGKDVNRSFPGSTAGSLASRVARTLTKKVMPMVDFIIDLHTGGSSRFNYPQIRYAKSDPLAKELGRQFGAPFLIQKPFISKSLRKVAFEMKIPTIVYEAGESIRFDGYSIDLGVKGIKRILSNAGMISVSNISFDIRMFHVTKTSWIRSPNSGLFIWSKASGQKVSKGEPLGYIKDPQGLKSVTIFANRTGYIIGHNNASVVNQGDALFHITYEQEEIS